MVNEQQKPPDTLQEKESDDSKFVTEELAAMKPQFHILLTAWIIITGLAALWYAIKIWPPEVPKGQAAIVDTTKIAITIKDSLKEKAADTLKQVALAKQDSIKSNVNTSEEDDDRGILLLKLSFLFGVLGGATHGFSSLMNYRGQRRLFRSWILWYFGRPILGGMLALIVYVALRAGFFSGDANSYATSLYGIAAFSTLTGMFTDKATDKLAEVFSTIFSTKGKEREGKLTND